MCAIFLIFLLRPATFTCISSRPRGIWNVNHHISLKLNIIYWIYDWTYLNANAKRYDLTQYRILNAVKTFGYDLKNTQMWNWREVYSSNKITRIGSDMTEFCSNKLKKKQMKNFLFWIGQIYHFGVSEVSRIWTEKCLYPLFIRLRKLISVYVIRSNYTNVKLELRLWQCTELCNTTYGFTKNY